MPKELKVLMLAPETPQVFGGGVRSCHFAMALTKVASVHLFVLLERSGLPMLEDLRRQFESVDYVPANSSFRAARRNGPESATAWRSIATIFAPWLDGGRYLALAGENQCVARAKDLSGGLGTVPRRVYAGVLQMHLQLGVRFFGLTPLSTLLRKPNFEAIEREMLQKFKQADPDVIWFEHSFLFPYAKHLCKMFPSASLVCNAHNVEYSLYERLAALAKEISARKWHQLQAEANRQLEQAAFETCNLTFCCSEEDARLVRKLAPLASVSVIPNGVDIDYFREGTEAPPTSGPRVIFTGGMNYDPNRDAVEYFVAKILPLIRQRQPTCRFCIAGSAAQSNFAHLAKADPSIEIASDVPDMRPYFAMSDVVVVPLRAGSGTRTKIFEAMAMGRAVVSTTLGAEGIACTPGVHLCLADTPESFAAQVTDLLGDAEKRRAMGQSARRLVCERFDWSKLREEAIEIIMERMVFQLKNNEALLESED